MKLTFVIDLSFYSHKRPGGHRRVRRLSLVEHFLESLKHRDTVGEDPERQQKRVEKVDAEKPQIGQTLQQTFRRGGTNLRYLTGVQGTTESYVHVVLEELRVVFDGLRHRDGTGIRPVEQVVEMNVVHALADVADPSGFFLRNISFHYSIVQLVTRYSRVSLNYVILPSPSESSTPRVFRLRVFRLTCIVGAMRCTVTWSPPDFMSSMILKSRFCSWEVALPLPLPLLSLMPLDIEHTDSSKISSQSLLRGTRVNRSINCAIEFDSFRHAILASFSSRQTIEMTLVYFLQGVSFSHIK